MKIFKTKKRRRKFILKKKGKIYQIEKFKDAPSSFTYNQEKGGAVLTNIG
jgi:hypothetical protein